jgi:hypothetical protein
MIESLVLGWLTELGLLYIRGTRIWRAFCRRSPHVHIRLAGIAQRRCAFPPTLRKAFREKLPEGAG